MITKIKTTKTEQVITITPESNNRNTAGQSKVYFAYPDKRKRCENYCKGNPSVTARVTAAGFKLKTVHASQHRKRGKVEQSWSVAIPRYRVLDEGVVVITNNVKTNTVDMQLFVVPGQMITKLAANRRIGENSGRIFYSDLIEAGFTPINI